MMDYKKLSENSNLKIIRSLKSSGNCNGCVFVGISGACRFPNLDKKKCGTDGIYIIPQKKIKFNI